MTELILGILSSSVLFLIFRLFPKYKVDTAQAIIVNYFTAFVTGCIPDAWKPRTCLHPSIQRNRGSCGKRAASFRFLS